MVINKNQKKKYESIINMIPELDEILLEMKFK